MVKKYDHVRPTEDLSRWFSYTNISEDQFNSILINSVIQEFGILKIMSGIKKIHGVAQVVMVKFLESKKKISIIVNRLFLLNGLRIFLGLIERT